MVEVAYKPIGTTKKYPPLVEKFDVLLREEGKFKAFENSDTNAGGTTVYTVPVGKVFYLTSIMLAYRTGVVAPSSATAWVLVNEQFFLMLDPPDTANLNLVTTSNPSIPIKLNAGEKIIVESDDNNLFSRCVVGGYEISVEKRLEFMGS